MDFGLCDHSRSESFQYTRYQASVLAIFRHEDMKLPQLHRTQRAKTKTKDTTLYDMNPVKFRNVII